MTRTKLSLVGLALAMGLGAAFTPSRGAMSVARLQHTPWVARPAPASMLFAEEDAAEPAAEAAAEATEPESTEPVALDALVVDEEYSGTVKGVSDFGAFVDIGASNDGLVHKSQLSDSFVEDPASFVSVGDKVTVRVMRVDLEKKQISLSMKSKGAAQSRNRGDRGRGDRRGGRAAVDLSKYEKMDPKELIPGKVATIASYGAFVEFEDGVTGLLHISQIAEGRVESVESELSVGDAVEVRVTNVQDGKLSLTRKPYKEGETIGARSGGGRFREDNDDLPPERKPNEIPDRVDDIWSDGTEPKWADLIKESMETSSRQYDNALELKL